MLVCVTGVGAAATEAALRRLLEGPAAPPVVVAAGFCGGVRPGHQVGDLVLASEVADLFGNVWPATWPAGGTAIAAGRGRLLTVPALVSDPAEKRRLRQAHGALAVDMESAAAARLCHEYRVPFAALRAVSDGAETALSPGLAALLAGGRVSAARLARALLRRPAILPELLSLARATRLAARQLAVGLEALLSRAATALPAVGPPGGPAG
jgi:adenosylhomocysteine nucleosidase